MIKILLGVPIVNTTRTHYLSNFLTKLFTGVGYGEVACPPHEITRLLNNNNDKKMNSDASSFKRKQTAHITNKVNVSQVLPVIGNKFGDTCKQYTLVNLVPISLYTAHGKYELCCTLWLPE